MVIHAAQGPSSMNPPGARAALRIYPRCTAPRCELRPSDREAQESMSEGEQPDFLKIVISKQEIESGDIGAALNPRRVQCEQVS